jgi:hypothetical protein
MNLQQMNHIPVAASMFKSQYQPHTSYYVSLLCRGKAVILFFGLAIDISTLVAMASNNLTLSSSTLPLRIHA